MPVDEFTVPGARLHVELRGAGPLLLMVVGGSGDPDVYAAVAERLAAHRTVLTYARRGFARSPLDGPVPPAAERLAADAADAAALIGAHGDGAADVFGSSSGAIVVLELVVRTPQAVRRAVVHEPPVVDLLDDPEAWNARLAAVATTYRVRGPAAASAELLGHIGPGAPAPGAELPLSHRERQNRDFFHAHEFAQYPAHHLDLDTVAAATDRVVPAGGRESRGRDALFAATEALARRLGRPVADLPGGHGGYAEHPAAFAAELAALLDA